MKKYRDRIALGIGIFILLFFIGNACPIEHMFGIPCPGCNMFTALYWLLRGDIETATYYHPAWLFFLIYVGICAFLFYKYKADMKQSIAFKSATTVFLIVFIGIYVVRMITIFPNMPMQFNEQAIFVKLFHLF
ncbi:MAG: DUF2752 domain-containing protein [Longicatena sp.]